ncbi:hypothetical protein LCGC14_0667930 [marine sediment metagenome]|uniref:Uncharacterized protein n=1 Tax=marine sediment metagenome TaxID=412755 RepID=A0A0F9RBX1_9ZZZZ
MIFRQYKCTFKMKFGNIFDFLSVKFLLFHQCTKHIFNAKYIVI